MDLSRKKICWLVASPLTIRFFLMGHIAMLSREAELTVITSIDDPNFLKDIDGQIKIIPIGIQRKASPLKDLMILVQLFFIFRRELANLMLPTTCSKSFCV